MVRAARLLAAIAAAVWVVGGTAQAAPMRCSDEHKTCVAACQLRPLAVAPACLSGCNARRSNCLRSGCWSDSAKSYCGLLRQ